MFNRRVTAVILKGRLNFLNLYNNNKKERRKEETRRRLFEERKSCSSDFFLIHSHRSKSFSIVAIVSVSRTTLARKSKDFFSNF